MEVSDRIIAILDCGSPSRVNSMVKLALMPPGTGGAAIDSTIHMSRAVTIHVSEMPVCSDSSALRADTQKSTGTAGLYSI